MAKAAFKALVFDLFDTIVKWEPERLPVMELGGRPTHTTLPWVFPPLAARLGADFDRDRFIQVYGAVVEEIFVEREREGTEITCTERFARTLERLAAGPADERLAFAEELTRVHMDGVRAVTWAPADRVAAVRRLAPHYRLGLLSNFDDAQCGRDVLSDTGVADLFETVIISAEVGLRKPNPLIYHQMLERLRLAPHEVLFIGDTPREDVDGPHRVGMHTVWISKGAAGVPEGIPEPHYVIRDLADLPAILGV
ncbi:MAG TPA: HAD family hydrolase [Candidatus Binataceae bacterium]|nr:HAD family hydrolase [Candidatus Binataceae bacterium]